jgi:D-aminopeptidase
MCQASRSATATLVDDKIGTGITAVLPHAGDVFRDKLVAAAHVLNGSATSTS